MWLDSHSISQLLVNFTKGLFSVGRSSNKVADLIKFVWKTGHYVHNQSVCGLLKVISPLISNSPD